MPTHKEKANLTHQEKRNILGELAKAGNYTCFYLRAYDWGILDQEDLAGTHLSHFSNQYAEGSRLVHEYEAKHTKSRKKSSKLEEEVEEPQIPENPFEIATREAREVLEKDGKVGLYKYLHEQKGFDSTDELYGTYFARFHAEFSGGQREYQTRRKNLLSTVTKKLLLDLRIPPAQDARERIYDQEYSRRLSLLRKMPEVKELGIETSGYSSLRGKELATFWYDINSQIRKACKEENPEAYEEIVEEVKERNH